MEYLSELVHNRSTLIWCPLQGPHEEAAVLLGLRAVDFGQCTVRPSPPAPSHHLSHAVSRRLVGVRTSIALPPLLLPLTRPPLPRPLHSFRSRLRLCLASPSVSPRCLINVWPPICLALATQLTKGLRKCRAVLGHGSRTRLSLTLSRQHTACLCSARRPQQTAMVFPPCYYRAQSHRRGTNAAPCAPQHSGRSVHLQGAGARRALRSTQEEARQVRQASRRRWRRSCPRCGRRCVS